MTLVTGKPPHCPGPACRLPSVSRSPHGLRSGRRSRYEQSGRRRVTVTSGSKTGASIFVEVLRTSWDRRWILLGALLGSSEARTPGLSLGDTLPSHHTLRPGFWFVTSPALEPAVTVAASVMTPLSLSPVFVCWESTGRIEFQQNVCFAALKLRLLPQVHTSMSKSHRRLTDLITAHGA